MGLGHRMRKNKRSSWDGKPHHGDRFLLDAVRVPTILQMDNVSSTETEGFLSKKELSETCHSSAHFAGQEAGDSRRMDLCKAAQWVNLLSDSSLGLTSPEEPAGSSPRSLSQMSKDSSPFFQRMAGHSLHTFLFLPQLQEFVVWWQNLV